MAVSKKIKGITIEIGGDTTGLDKALSSVDGKSRKLQSELTAINKSLKFNPKNTELLSQKQDILNQSIANSKEKLEALRAAQEKVEKAFKANAEWEKQYAPLKEQIDSTKETLRKLKDQKEKVDEKFRNGQISAEQYQAYNKKVEETENKLKELNKSKKDLDKQFSDGHISAEEYREFQRELITTESNLSNLQKQLKETDNSVRQNNNGTAKLKDIMSGLKGKLSELKEKFQSAAAVLKSFGETAKKAAEISLKALETGIKSTAKTVETGIKGFEKYTAALTATVAAVSTFAVKSGASFETSMSKVQALSGATGDDLTALEEKAKEMGASTSKSATESADALGYMALAGWDTNQMLDGLEPILRASEAGTMDLATCSDLVTDSMSAMGIQTQELNHYLDVVSKTQASSNTSMQAMLEAYVGCGGTLKNLEVPLETSATLIGVLANRGIKGSEAGTSLNSVLVNLMGASGKASDALNLLGVSMYENGQRKDITVMLNELNGRLAECDEQTRDTFTAMIGGKTQMDTLQALLAGVSGEYDELNGEISDCDGYMLEAAKTMQDNVQGAFTALKSAAEGAGIAIYDTFKGRLKNTLNEVTGYVSTISEHINTDGIIGLVSAFSNIKSKAIEYILSAVPEIAENAADSALAFNSALISITDIIINTLPQISEKILPSMISVFFQLIDKLISRIPQIVPEFFGIGSDLLIGITDGMLKSSEKLSETFPRIFRLAIPTISKTIPEIFSKGTEIITTLAESIINSIPVVINSVQQCAISIVSNLINSFLPLLPDLLSAGLELISALLGGIMFALPQIISTVNSCIGSLLSTLMEHLPEILDAGVKILMAIISGIIDMLPQLINTAVDLIFAIADALINNLDLLLEAALQIVICLCGAILDNIDKIWEFIPKLIEGIVDAVIDNLDILIRAAIEILTALGAALVSCTSELIVFIPQVMDAIVNAFTERDWTQTGKDILENIFDGILEIGEKASDVLKPAVNKISEFINGGIGHINNLIDGINNISIGDLSFNIPHIPEIPMLAKGGTLLSGSAIVGEAGAELLTVANGRAVVQPLSDGNTTIKSVQTNNDYKPVFSGDIVVPVYMYPDSAEFSRAVVTANQLNAAMTGGR